jgi:hypothetical protein
MPLSIEYAETPDADTGGERNPNNPDTFEDTDNNSAGELVQSDYN